MPIPNPPSRFFILCTFLLLLTSSALAQSAEVVTITAESLQNGKAVELDKLGWKYSPGDDPRFADPQFDDRGWETLKSTGMARDTLPQSGWRGIGWLRLHLRVAPELVEVPLNLEMFHLGASEIYLDGKQIERFGVVGKTQAEETVFNPNALPLGISFQPGTNHVIAVRYSNQRASDINSFWGKWQIGFYGGIGFTSRIKRFDKSTNQGPDNVYGFSYNLFQGAFSLALGVLHFLLFVFLPRQRANLFYSTFLLGLATNNFLVDIDLSTHYGLPAYYLLQIITHTVALTYHVALLAFVYTAFNQHILRRIWSFLTVGVIGIALIALLPGRIDVWVDSLLRVAISLESLRIMYRALRQQREGAWLVGVGLLFYFVMASRTFLAAIIQTYGSWFILMDVIGWYGLMLTISIHLAREFARTNDNLEVRLVQVKQLSAEALEHEKVKAENDRRAEELEEARQLQLSMLPKKVPQLPGLEIAAYMKTASEVGGDYYDFHLGEDGTLTIAVGDATGHGLKAGTMVTATKSLFDTLAYHPDIPHIFERLTRTLKRMNLRGLFMAMMIVKVKDNQLSASIAGMPPVLIFRQMSGEVEEIAIRGIPLGGLSNYQYQQWEVALACGDVVLLMSDGLPERFNAQQEMLDYAPIKQTFARVHSLPSQEIIQQLVALGERWADGQSQDDDVTFVVVKVVESKS